MIVIKRDDFEGNVEDFSATAGRDIKVIIGEYLVSYKSEEYQDVVLNLRERRLSCEEIAHILGKSKNSMYTTLYRLRKRGLIPSNRIFGSTKGKRRVTSVKQIIADNPNISASELINQVGDSIACLRRSLAIIGKEIKLGKIVDATTPVNGVNGNSDTKRAAVLYNEGKSKSEIVEIMGKSLSHVSSLLRYANSKDMLTRVLEKKAAGRPLKIME